MHLRDTEKLHPKARGLDARAGAEILSVLLRGQQAALAAVGPAIPAIGRAAEHVTQTLRGDGRLVFAAAGSSGLMALADGLELPGTFGIANDRISIRLAGGMAVLGNLTGSGEDDTEAARADAAGIGAGDCVIGISASGSTPYVLAFLDASRQAGALTIGIANTPGSAVLTGADVAIYLPTPPEVIAGSTRLGAATAQKAALNMLSTLVGIRLGHVYDGHMVNLHADNQKLVRRAQRMVSDIAACSTKRASACLAASDGAVKPAVLMALGVETPQDAARILARASHDLRRAISDITPGGIPAQQSE